MLSVQAFAESLSAEYETHRIGTFRSRRFSAGEFHAVIDSLAKTKPGLFQIRPAGKSFEGRPIRLVTVGSGQTSILLWSQMHGDESTATMAIADILNYIAATLDEDIMQFLRAHLTIHFLPMLNPDGAVRFQRRTGQNIDMNRDAMALRTPEARLLKNLQKELSPAFGFNLHDQALSTVGSSKELSALALLAPSFDQQKSDNEVRRRAKLLAALLARTVIPCAGGRLTRYDDSFEPRAFGDSMQRWGTSTVLIESGHTMGDHEKDSIRKLNYVGILASLYGIATNEYKTSDIDMYERLPFNGKNAFDLIIRNIRIEHPEGTPTPADLAISYEVDTHTEAIPLLADLGDLQPFIGINEVDGREVLIPQPLLVPGKPFQWQTFIAQPL